MDLRKVKKITLLLSALLIIPPAVHAADDEYRLLPADESVRESSLQVFLDSLRQAVKFREPEPIAAALYSQLNNGKEVKKGAKQFVEHWRLDSQDSELWDELDEILRLGGGFIRSDRGVTYCAPYVFTHFPDDLDIFGHGVVIDDGVDLKASPSANAKTVKKLSYHLLRVNDWRSVRDKQGKGGAWIKVSTLDGADGYVAKDKIRSPSDYHACFLAFPNGWRLISMTATE
jgi:hypothetical protein